jgi:hypothetical protein
MLRPAEVETSPRRSRLVEQERRLDLTIDGDPDRRGVLSEAICPMRRSVLAPSARSVLVTTTRSASAACLLASGIRSRLPSL